MLGKPIHYVPAHVDVEADVSSVQDFIGGTNSVVLLGHGVTELLAQRAGSRPAYRSDEEIRSMYRFAESIIYPKRAEGVMHED